MANESFMDKFRSFLGLHHQQPPRNDFRNPIWGDDDDDDGDDLFERHAHVNVYSDPQQLHREITRQMQDMFSTFGGLFGDLKHFFHDEGAGSFNVPELTNPDSDNFDNNSIRDYYLKPGYHSHREPASHRKEDVDLDGKISSQDISGLLKKRDMDTNTPAKPFDGNIVPGRSFCQTIITTSIKKPDGTVETRRIVKSGNEVVEETITTSSPSDPEPRSPHVSGLDNIPQPDAIYNNILSELSRWRNVF